MALEPKLAGHLGESLAPHQLGVTHGERAFRLVREAGQQKVGHDQAEHPIAEKLQALVAVVPRAPTLGGARMGERPNQQLGPCEAMTQALGQRVRVLCRPPGPRAVPRRGRYSMPSKMRLNRIAPGHFHTSNKPALSSCEKNRNSARPIRFRNGTKPTA